MTDAFGQWIPLAPVVLMVTVVIMNHAVTFQRNERKTAAEASRLSAALNAELLVMLDIYRMNLELLDQKAKYLLSARSSMVVYRGNINKLTGLLDGSVIKHVVRAFSQNERIEGVVAAHSNFKCNLTYQFSSAEIDFDALRQMYAEAVEQATSTCRVLEGETLSSEAPSSGTETAALYRFFNQVPKADGRRLLAA